MTDAGTSYEKTGRYLGIQNGYFLYGGSPNWVYCYCLGCWQSLVLQLSFVSQPISEKNAKISQLETQVATLTTNYNAKVQEFNTKNEENIKLQAQLQEMKNNLEEKNQEINKNHEDITESRDKIQSLNEEIKNYKEEVSSLNQILEGSVPGFGLIGSLRKIFQELDVEQKKIIEFSELNLESFKSSLQEIISSHFQQKVQNVVALCEESRMNISMQIENLEIAEKQMIESMKIGSDDFTDEEISEALKPIRRKRQEKELNSQKWVECSNRFTSLTNYTS